MPDSVKKHHKHHKHHKHDASGKTDASAQARVGSMGNSLLAYFYIQAERTFSLSTPFSCTCETYQHDAFTSVYYFGDGVLSLVRMGVFALFCTSFLAELPGHDIGEILQVDGASPQVPALKGYQWASALYESVSEWQKQSINTYILIWIASEYVAMLLRHFRALYMLNPDCEVLWLWYQTCAAYASPNEEQLAELETELLQQMPYLKLLSEKEEKKKEKVPDKKEKKDVPDVSFPNKFMLPQEHFADLYFGQPRSDSKVETSATSVIKKIQKGTENSSREEKENDTGAMRDSVVDLIHCGLSLWKLAFVLHIALFILIVLLLGGLGNLHLFFISADRDKPSTATMVSMVLNGLVPIVTMELSVNVWILILFGILRQKQPLPCTNWTLNQLIAYSLQLLGLSLVVLLDSWVDTASNNKRDQANSTLWLGGLLLVLGTCAKFAFRSNLHKQLEFKSDGLHRMLWCEGYARLLMELAFCLLHVLFLFRYNESASSQCNPTCAVSSMQWFTVNSTLYLGPIDHLSTHAYNVTMAACAETGSNIASLGEDCAFSKHFANLILAALFLLGFFGLLSEALILYRGIKKRREIEKVGLTGAVFSDTTLEKMPLVP